MSYVFYIYVNSISVSICAVDILTLIFDNISQEIDTRLREKYRGTREVVTRSLRLLSALARGNDLVQRRIYDRMDTLLKVKGVEREVATTLTEVHL